MMEIDYEKLGIRIRQLRKAKGMNQKTLAERSNQTPSNISHVEKGATKISLPNLVKIANVLGVSVNQLLDDSLFVSEDVLFKEEVERLLSDCSKQEKKIIMETVRTLKVNLRQFC